MFVATAETALVRGTRDPCGLFVRLVRGGLWHRITQGDKDAVHRRLKGCCFGDFEKRQPVERRIPPPQAATGVSR
jgi:hypothetical protein